MTIRKEEKEHEISFNAGNREKVGTLKTACRCPVCRGTHPGYPENRKHLADSRKCGKTIRCQNQKRQIYKNKASGTHRCLMAWRFSMKYSVEELKNKKEDQTYDRKSARKDPKGLSNHITAFATAKLQELMTIPKMSMKSCVSPLISADPLSLLKRKP